MLWLILIVSLPLLWALLGCVVLASLDHEDRRLFRWAKECPLGFWFPVAIWPYIVWLRWAE